MEGYNSSKSSSFILYLDANNLYGRAMQEYLPWKNFEWMRPHHLNYDFIKGLEPEATVKDKDFYILHCTIPVPVTVLCLSAIFVRNINSSELHFQSVALRSQYSDHAPEAVALH